MILIDHLIELSVIHPSRLARFGYLTLAAAIPTAIASLMQGGLFFLLMSAKEALLCMIGATIFNLAVVAILTARHISETRL